MSEVRNNWPYPTEESCLGTGEVHVWSTDLLAPERSVAELFEILSDDERQRAMRFKFERHRRRFAVCRARQRLILSRYLNVAADRLSFQYESLGKPLLAPPWQASGLRFNTSNSHELAVYAVADDRELGIDVEFIRPLRNMDRLAARYFAPSERQSLDSIPEASRLAAFYACWTRKEAILKALGTGLSLPLDRFAVSLLPDQPAKLLSFDGDPLAESRWWLHGMKPADCYIAALASPGDPPQVKYWKWKD